MLWTLSSEALRRGAGQFRMTRFPRWTPESNSVRCGTLSTGGCGGRRFPHAGSVKAKVKRQKAKIRNEEKDFALGESDPCTFAFCLLPFAFIRGRSG
jgi:hypothetical protein